MKMNGLQAVARPLAGKRVFGVVHLGGFVVLDAVVGEGVLTGKGLVRVRGQERDNLLASPDDFMTTSKTGQVPRASTDSNGHDGDEGISLQLKNRHRMMVDSRDDCENKVISRNSFKRDDRTPTGGFAREPLPIFLFSRRAYECDWLMLALSISGALEFGLLKVILFFFK